MLHLFSILARMSSVSATSTIINDGADHQAFYGLRSVFRAPDRPRPWSQEMAKDNEIPSSHSGRESRQATLDLSCHRDASASRMDFSRVLCSMPWKPLVASCCCCYQGMATADDHLHGWKSILVYA